MAPRGQRLRGEILLAAADAEPPAAALPSPDGPSATAADPISVDWHALVAPDLGDPVPPTSRRCWACSPAPTSTFRTRWTSACTPP
jgi:hypothetical protein